jgi:hypothetical protein
LENSIDIALINETHLKSGTRFSHPNYLCYRLDRVGRLKGGVAVILPHTLPHTLSTTFSSDHLPVLFGVELNVRQEVPDHFVFDYRNADWALFRREMDSRMDLNFLLDRVESGADVDTMIRTFTEAIFEARAAPILFVRPSCFCLVLSPQIKSMAGGVCGRTAQELCRDFIKNKFCAVPALKIDELTLITKSEKANAIASKFSLAHENSLQSDQSSSVQDSCSALYSNAFNNDSSSYTSPRKINNIIKKLYNGKDDLNGVVVSNADC